MQGNDISVSLKKMIIIKKMILNLRVNPEVKITNRAFNDITEIYKYISNHLESPENAL